MPLRAIILHNFWLKSFSVALATVIWLAIHYGIHNDLLILNRTLPQVIVRVPVTTRQRAGDTRTFRIIPDAVVVEAVGETAALQRTAKKDIHVYIDLTEFDSKEPTTEPLQSEVPPDINVVEISPAFVTVQQISP